MHVLRILRGQQRNYGAGGLANDLGDQFEGVLGAQAEADERHVRTFSLGDSTDFLDIDLARDHLVAERRNDLRKQLEPVAPLVCDQDAQMLPVLGHPQRPLFADTIRTIVLSRPRPIVREGNILTH